MILNIIVLLLIVGITFMHSIFGLFSGIINTFCCILAAVVALGSFEAVDRLVTGQFGLSPSYSTPCVLVLMFVLTLLILRALADNLIRGNVRLPMYVDWGGAAVCGFINAMICMGIMVLGIQLLPFGGRVMMFQRIERTGDLEGDFVKFERSGVWLNPDGFTVGLVNMLSNGSLRGGTTFASVYPDFTRWVYWTGNTVQPESLTAPIREISRGRDGVKNGISVVEWWTEAGPVDVRYAKNLPTKDEDKPTFKRIEKYAPADGGKLIGVRLSMSDSAADRDRVGGYHRFRPSMIRIVGADGAGRPLDYSCRMLRGTGDESRKDFRIIVDIDQNFAIATTGDYQLDVYFEVDRDFEPAFVEYRRFARAALAPAALAKAAPAKAPSNTAVASTETDGGSGTGSGQTAFINAIVNPSGAIDSLPFECGVDRVRGAGDVEIAGEVLVKGRFSGPKKQLEVDPLRPKLTKLRAAENLRMFQVRFNPNKAGSLAGQVFNFVARTVNQYHAVDRDGEKYDLVGYYAIVQRDGEPYFELFYNGPNPKESPHEISFNMMLDFKSVTPADLTRPNDDVEIGLLFLVPPGKVIVEIKNQAGHGVSDFALSSGG